MIKSITLLGIQQVRAESRPYAHPRNPSQNVGPDHDRPEGHVPDCAALCARQGLPVGVLVDDETVWVLVTAPAVLADYMAGTVRVTGEVRSQGVLIPHRVELQRGDEWTFVL